MSEQILSRDTLTCCWEVKQPTPNNNPTFLDESMHRDEDGMHMYPNTRPQKVLMFVTATETNEVSTNPEDEISLPIRWVDSRTYKHLTDVATPSILSRVG